MTLDSDSGLDLFSPVSAGSSWDSNLPASGRPSTSARSTPRAGRSSKRGGREPSASRTSRPSRPTTSPPPTCSSAGSPARTSQSEPSTPHELACAVLGLASGLTWRGWSKTRALHGSSSRTWRMAWEAGSPESSGSWSDKATRRYQSACRHAGSASPIAAPDASCLPTPTASSYGSSNNGCPGDGRESYSKKGKASLATMARREGGTLDPRFVEWMMGFPQDWTLPASGH